MQTTSVPSPQQSFLFLSHANPEDNYFASWLASKLSLLGYQVWCDIERLKGGEDFWDEIQTTIRSRSIKFLFVISKHSVAKDGTMKELAVADRIRDRGDFIIPLRIDETQFDALPPELIRLNAIDFSSNWAAGLTQLTEKLQSDSMLTTQSFEVEKIKQWWHSVNGSLDSGIVSRTEPYWTNWFRCTLPKYLYLHQIPTVGQNSDVTPYPYVAKGEWIITFSEQSDLNPNYSVAYTHQILVEELLRRSGPYRLFSPAFELHKPNHVVIELIRIGFERYLRSQGLQGYEISDGLVFYFNKKVRGELSTIRVKLDRYDLTYVSLEGRTHNYQWHYGIKSTVFLFPEPLISISHHIVFTEGGVPVDIEKQHSLRRRLGASWYNKQWRDRLLASMLLLREQSDMNSLLVSVAGAQTVQVDISPIQVFTQVGYRDPQ